VTKHWSISPLRVLSFCLIWIAGIASVELANAAPCISTASVVVANGIGLQCATVDGVIEYDWTAPAAGVLNSLGSISVSFGGNPMFTVSPAIFSNQGAIAAQGATVSGTTISITYLLGSAPLYINITPSFDGNIVSAVIAQSTSQGNAVTISSVELGSWPVSLSGREIPVPYYTQTVHYFDSLGLFANSYWDPYVSHATTFGQSTTAQYLAKTDGTTNALYEKFSLVVSPQIDQVFPLIHNSPSPYMQQLAGRVVFDINSGTFAQIGSELANLGDHGVNNCVAIIHVWQNSGFDSNFPESYPANSALGGNTGLLPAMQAATGMNCFAALHENYIDYYPGYPQFTAKSVALNGDGSEVDGWLEPATNAQAYVAKPGWFVANAATQSPLIHANLGTTATFIDVNSANPPWRQAFSMLNPQNNLWQGVDMDATVAGAGMFSNYINGSTQLWAYERATHGGPVFGEGKDHWFWSGLLDGVEAQVGPSEGPGTLPGNQGIQTPLFVDFDLTRIHPLQVNHGMGFFSRWVAPGQTVYSTFTSDAYRMQEVIFGHAPWLGEVTGGEWLWAVVPRALLEQSLVSPVAARYATQTADQIQYQINNAWTTPSLAAAAGDFSRVKVTYSNGDTIVANSQEGILSFDGFDIPQDGWLAEGNGLLAYTALVGGVFADYAQTSTSYFANARNANDFATLGCALGSCLDSNGNGSAAPAMAQLQSLAYNPVSNQFTVQWTVFQNLDPTKTYENFIELEDANGNQVTLTSASASGPSTPWLEGQLQSAIMSAAVPNGVFTVHGGICDTGTTGENAAGSNAGCLPLYGTGDGITNHYLLGTMTASGGITTFTPQAPPPVLPDARLNMAGSVVNFGPVQTDGMVYLNQDSTTKLWTLRVWPRFARVSTSQTATIQINNSAIGRPGALLCDSTTSVQAVPVAGTNYWQVNYPAGAKACQFTASGNANENETAATATVSPSNLIFPGNTAAGSQSTPQIATLSNNGTSAIAIGSVVVSGANSNSFQVTNNCGSSLAAGASCSVTAIFTPSVAGTAAGGIVITDSAGNSPQSISLLGTAATTPAVSLSSTNVPFDNQEIGNQSTARIVSLSNTGNAVLTISGIALAGTNASSFSVSSACGSSLPAGQSCSISVSFTPTTTGPQTATVVINSNAASSPDSLILSGTGAVTPTIGVSAVSGQGVNPATAVLGRNTTFTARVQGSTATSLTWSLQGAGSLSSSEVYSAPAVMPGNPNVVVTVALTADPTVTTSYLLTLVNPAPSIYGTSPNVLSAGQTTSVTISGTGFVAGSTVLVNGAAVSTTYQSFTSLIAQVPVSATASGAITLTVSNPAPGGGLSAQSSITVVQPTITVTAVSGQGVDPATAVLGRNTTFNAGVHGSTATGLTWSLQGAGSLSSSEVYSAPTVMPGNPNIVVTATLTADPLITTSYSMTLVNPVPSIYGTSLKVLPKGQTSTVTITGTGFVAGSTVMVNNTPVSTTYQSFTSLIAQVPVNTTASGAIALTVSNPAPGGGVSAPHSVSIK